MSIYILATVLVAVAAPAVAGDVGDWLDSPDWRQWGAQELGAQQWGAQDLGDQDDEFATVAAPSAEGPSNTGRKLAAGGMSLLIPGAGQFYNGDRGKGLVMLGIDVVIWGAYIAFDNQADDYQQEARDWAGIYAGTSGDHPETYWQSVGRYLDGDQWYESQLREARAFGESSPPAPNPADLWQWRNEDFKDSYQGLRADANSAYDRRDLMILFAILNRAVSAFDAVRNGGARAGDGGSATGARILGADLALEVSPSWQRPEARATASWSF